MHIPDILPSARRGFRQVIDDVESSGIIEQLRNQRFRVRSFAPKNVRQTTECWFPDILPSARRGFRQVIADVESSAG